MHDQPASDLAASVPDPFLHLPSLRGRLTPPEKSALRLTPDVLRAWDERARSDGRPDNWRLADDAREATRRAVLGDRDPAHDLWIYAYGSLMWDPGIHFAEVRLAALRGYQRRFSYRITGGRGTPQCPALMLSLESQPGCCHGLAFRVAAGSADMESEILWRREMIRGGYRPLMLPVDTPQGGVTALVFTANTAHPEYAGELPLVETAEVIATACGPLGSNRHYLEQLAGQLALLGLEDAYVTDLLDRVRVCGG